jgi:hypothetical protein
MMAKEETGPLVITHAEVENFERCSIAKFDLAPRGVTLLKGRNKQGKSSVVNGIKRLLGGAMQPDYDAAMKVIEPIKAGEKSARVAVKIGRQEDGTPVLDAELRITRKTTSLYVFPLSSDGQRGIPLAEPASVLAQLFGALGVLDPYDFVRMPEKKQIAAFLTLVEFPDVSDELAKLEISVAEGQALPDALEDERARAFEYRTQVNRDLKRMEAARSEVHLPLGWKTMTTVDVNALLTKQDELQARKSEAVTARQNAGFAERTQKTATEAVARAERVLAEAQAALKAAQENHRKATAAATKAREAAEAIVDPDEELEALRTELQQAETTNATCRQATAALKQDEQIAATKAEADKLTARIEDIEGLKRQVLEQSKSPLPGLAYDRERGVTFNDQPLCQASDSEKVLIGAAIAHAQGSRLRWTRVPGSLYESMDDPTAEKFNAQLIEWGMPALCEVVLRSGDTGGLIIEDGVLDPDSTDKD